MLSANLTVTNSENSPGPVNIKVLDGHGAEIDDTQQIGPGESATFDIHWLSGHYSVQGQATEKSGYYTFSIKD